ncbi:MAG: hypothetical protein L6461_06460 [Anaerolineae bacterium]|nr:hypothetical protein [Anaerolineae bacterium]
METTRKTWVSPQVFVLGIEGTQAGTNPGDAEEIVTGGWVCTGDPFTEPETCTQQVYMIFPENVSP